MSEKPTNGINDGRADQAPPAGEDRKAEVAPEDNDIPVLVQSPDEPGPAGSVESSAEAAPPRDEVPREQLPREQLLEELERADQERAALHAAVASLQDKAEALESEKKDLYERLLRAVADADNARKRGKKDLADARIDARTAVLKEMLPVIDNLERAVNHAEAAGQDMGPIGEGVKLVLRQFAQALERCDVRSLDAEGKPFDPNVHEAIAQAESADVPAGTVLQVMQRGYTIGERLLRPSLVVVARAPAPPAPTDEDETSAANGGAGPNGSAAAVGAHDDEPGTTDEPEQGA
jgi:molecular chaperone GrpE